MSNQTLYSDYMKQHNVPTEDVEYSCRIHREAKLYAKEYCVSWWNDMAKETGWILLPPDLAKIVIEDVIEGCNTPDEWFEEYYDKMKYINFVTARLIGKGLLSVTDAYQKMYNMKD